MRYSISGIENPSRRVSGIQTQVHGRKILGRRLKTTLARLRARNKRNAACGLIVDCIRYGQLGRKHHVRSHLAQRPQVTLGPDRSHVGHPRRRARCFAGVYFPALLQAAVTADIP